jgi:hypothetical protein
VKKILALSVAFGLGLGVVGCGGPATTGKVSSHVTPSKAETPPPSKAEKPSEKKEEKPTEKKEEKPTEKKEEKPTEKKDK